MVIILKGVDLPNHTIVFLWRTLNHYKPPMLCTLSWFVPLGNSSEYIPYCLRKIWFLLTEISYKVKRCTKGNIYTKYIKNKSVGYHTNLQCKTTTRNLGGGISLQLHAKIYYAVEYYEPAGKVCLLHTTSNTSCNTSRKFLPTIPEISSCNPSSKSYILNEILKYLKSLQAIHQAKSVCILWRTRSGGTICTIGTRGYTLKSFW